jgi:hypothetical protein
MRYLFTAEPAENSESQENRLSHLCARRDLGGKFFRMSTSDSMFIGSPPSFLLLIEGYTL